MLGGYFIELAATFLSQRCNSRKHRTVRQADQDCCTISTPRMVPDGARRELQAAFTGFRPRTGEQRCSALRSTSGFCRPQCSSTHSCQRRSRLPPSSFRLPGPPNVSDANARSSGRSGATDKALLTLGGDGIADSADYGDGAGLHCAGQHRHRNKGRLTRTAVESPRRFRANAMKHAAH